MLGLGLGHPSSLMEGEGRMLMDEIRVGRLSGSQVSTEGVSSDEEDLESKGEGLPEALRQGARRRVRFCPPLEDSASPISTGPICWPHPSAGHTSGSLPKQALPTQAGSGSVLTSPPGAREGP